MWYGKYEIKFEYVNEQKIAVVGANPTTAVFISTACAGS